MDAKLVICLMGPTAIGKTTLAVELTQHFPCEIISVDSAMVYQTMDIGTAKPSSALLKRIPHQLIDIRDPSQTYSAGELREDALAAIEAIFTKNRIPLLVGGTMLYFHVLQQGIATLPKANPFIRKKLKHLLETQGLQKLYSRLQVIDPTAAQHIHPNDSQRIQRALEITEISGKTATELQRTHSNAPLSYRFLNIALVPLDRDKLHNTITMRFQKMLKEGFVDEVENLFKRDDLHPDLAAIRTVGYRQIWRYLSGNSTYTQMQEDAIVATRQLAKRQLTWLRSWKSPLTPIYVDTSLPINQIIKKIQIS